jgi:hypothetical protein
MSEVRIDRLSLHVPGLSESDGRRLALQVAAGLSSAAAAGGGRDIPALRLDLMPGPDVGVDELARQIVDEFVRQVRQLP